ncbi:MAG: hypothetical protein VR66_23130 [Peptococcaceae bacterium BRH_c23]|nr:MAG: hypothetical protein VR66_23130 [Peptococcaceae bacterium BRH_c23]KJS80120.1 MAG: hypothetical protein JL57_28800 [Desulfosporosinus sp. BICA1-9]
MYVTVKMTLVLISMVYLLKHKISIGYVMLAASAILFIMSTRDLTIGYEAIIGTLRRQGSWEVIIAMYFVMCLEYELRTSGSLDGFMTATRQLFGSDRLLLAFMPALLGLLPSVGGALFSAPLVDNASRSYQLSAETKTAINYWFRHIWEFSNPIVPALLLASEITAISLNVLIAHLAVYTCVGALLGWLVLLTGRNYNRENILTKGQIDQVETTKNAYQAVKAIFYAIAPIVLNIILVTGFHLSAAVSMALVVGVMVVVFRLRTAQIGEMFKESFHAKLLLGLLAIFFFQQMLSETGSVNEIVDLLRKSGVSPALLITILTFTVGVLTGQMTSFVAITFPIVNVIAPGDVNLVTIGYVMGVVGSMLSPAHLCLVVSLDYFKASIINSLKPVALMTGIITVLVFILN